MLDLSPGRITLYDITGNLLRIDVEINVVVQVFNLPRQDAILPYSLTVIVWPILKRV